MKIKKEENLFWKSFNHPSVIIFISIGTAVIFLTFLTNNNALEIVISALASVFIGIGVNNFTVMETKLREEKKMNIQISQSFKVLEFTISKITGIQKNLNAENWLNSKSELEELQQLLSLTIGLLNDKKENNL